MTWCKKFAHEKERGAGANLGLGNYSPCLPGLSEALC